jgi:GR25 family glycosyltransferase involved in LPS biosynthesis
MSIASQFQMVENDYERVIILEDDVRFSVYFKTKLHVTLSEAENVGVDWELM